MTNCKKIKNQQVERVLRCFFFNENFINDYVLRRIFVSWYIILTCITGAKNIFRLDMAWGYAKQTIATH